MPVQEEERPKRTRSVAVASIWGRPPEHTSHWTIGKKTDGKWPRQQWKVRGEQTAEDIWPINMLDAALVCRRWGPGEYRVTWIGTVQGKRETLGVGRTVMVLPPETEGEAKDVAQQATPHAPAPASVPVPLPPALPDALGQFQALWNISQGQKETELARARETFDQQLRNQAQTYDQLLTLQAKITERSPPPADERLERIERMLRRQRRQMREEREQQESDGLARQEPASLLSAMLGQLAPHIPMILSALPGLLQRFAAGAAAAGQTEQVHRP